MIVVCTTCQARFKVADEKIGPRGAKVRCSKCQTVFIVHRELGVMPAEAAPPAAPAAIPAAPAAPARAPGRVELDLESEPMSGVRASGFIADPFSRPAAADPFSIPASAPAPVAAPEPFGSAPSHSPFGGAHDPFGGADPFGSPPPPPVGGSSGAVDPFVATVASTSPGLPTSAVTDLSDLIGGGGGPAGTPPPSAAAPAATPPPEPSGILETGFDFDNSAGPSPELEAAPSPVASPALPDFGGEPDLALAERTPDTGMPVHGAAPVPMPGSDGFGGVDPFGMPAGGGGAPLDFGGPDEDAFASAPELDSPPQHHPLPPPPEPGAPAVPPPRLEPSPRAAPEEPSAGEEAAVVMRHRSSRFRAVIINVISLAALLLVAVAILAFWRGVRPGGGMLQPGKLFGSIAGQQSPFSVAQLRSGLFERAEASPVLFVTGKAVSHAASAVAGLRVKVELVRKGAVVGRGEVRAGAVPTPEQLAGAKDAAGVAAVLDGLGANAPAAVKPGAELPFLVAIADYPSDVTGIGLRVTVEPVGVPPSEKDAPSR